MRRACCSTLPLQAFTRSGSNHTESYILYTDGLNVCGVFPFRLRNVFRATTVLNFSTSQLPKSDPTLMFSAFWLRNVPRATTACAFSTSQFRKVFRTGCDFNILTSKRGSRPNCLDFFDIPAAPDMRCLKLFVFQICFTPQRRAIFHLSFPQMALHPPL